MRGITVSSIWIILGLSMATTSFAGPQIQHWETANGANVYFVEAPEIPILDVRFVFDAGSARDNGKPGLAHLTNRLIGEGAGELDANQFKEQMADTGASLQTGALRDMAWIGFRSLTEAQYLDPAVKLMALAVGQPRLDEGAFSRIKGNTLIAIKRDEQSPGETAKKSFYKAIYGDHPYASPMRGSANSIGALTRDEVVRFHQTYYVAKNLNIAIVGAVSKTQAETIAATISAGLQPGAAPAELSPVEMVAEGRDEHIEFPSIQSHVHVGQPGMKRGDADYFPLLVGNHVLGGGGLVSILFDEVREKRGLSYSVNSYFRPMAELGPFVASLQTDNSQQTEAIKVLRNELEKFVANGPTPQALQAAKQNLIGGFPLRIDSNAKIIEYLAMIGFYKLPLDYLDKFPAAVAAVTVDDVRSAFQRRLDTEKMVTVVVGQASAKDG